MGPSSEPFHTSLTPVRIMDSTSAAGGEPGTTAQVFDLPGQLEVELLSWQRAVGKRLLRIVRAREDLVAHLAKHDADVDAGRFQIGEQRLSERAVHAVA